MANKNQPIGAIPHGQVLRARKYLSSAITYPGDFLKLKSDGTVEAAGATDACVGVALTYASAAGQDVQVADAPTQMFQMDCFGGTPAQTDVNLNYRIKVNTASSVYRISREEIDLDNGGTTATLPLKLLALITDVKDLATGADADCVVMINNHQLNGGTGTLGV